jgi:hypothetical protein
MLGVVEVPHSCVQWMNFFPSLQIARPEVTDVLLKSMEKCTEVSRDLVRSLLLILLACCV